MTRFDNPPIDVTCIIPARAGSKGLPGKNVRNLCGRPLLAWTVLAAIEACGRGAVFVTTDDPEIKAVARCYGATVIDRPDELALDISSSEDALIHALKAIESNSGELPERVVFLQCTSPLTLPVDIRAAVSKMDEEQADSVFSASASHRFLWRPAPDGGAVGINHDLRARLRRQDRDPEYAENGAIYAMKTTGFLETKHRFFGKTSVSVMPEERSWEIDSKTDFAVAEVLMRERLQSERLTLLPETIGAVVFDFDGVMTDNRVITDQSGVEAVSCDRSDGLGLARLRTAGLRLLVLSTERNPVVAARCAKLGLECIHGEEDKATRLVKWLGDEGIDPATTVYVGNDRNDMGCLELVGCPVVVADAYPEALQRALLVLDKPGGHGAVRELCDLIQQTLTAETSDDK